jgi:hypothetical protein
MYRFWNAFTILLLGLGVLVLVVGLVTEAFSAAMGVVGLVALWVIAIALRVYTVVTDQDEDFGRYRPRSLYDRYDRYDRY